MRALRDGERLALLSPGVGTFTEARAPGVVLSPGQRAGVLTTLSQPVDLIVPEGVRGVIASERPERVHHPVGFGDVLYELELLSADGIEAFVADKPTADGALALRALSSGRFYHRASPKADPFVREGDVLESGRPIGLIEVMKTFNHVHYHPDGGLPARARLVRFLVPDGGEVRSGDGLIEVAPA